MYAGDCFAALRWLRELVSLPANDRHLRLPGAMGRDAEQYLAQIRTFAGRSNQRIDLGEPCVRFELGDQVTVCEERSGTSIYFQPRPYD